MSCIITMGGDTLLSKEYFNLDIPQRREFSGNILGINFSVALGIFLLIFIFYKLNLISYYLKIPGMLIFLAIIVALSSVLFSLLLTILQLEKKSKIFALFSNSRTVLEICISLFLIIYMGLKWEGRVIGISGSMLLFAAIALLLLKRRETMVLFPSKYGKSILILGFPLVVSYLASWMNEMFSRIMINNVINVGQTGLYSVGSRFGMVVMMVQIAFTRAWLPYFFENVTKEEFKLKIVKYTYVYILALVIFSLLFGIFGKHLLYLMVGKDFFAADKFIILIAMAYCFDGIWKIFMFYLVQQSKTQTFSNIVLLSAVINVILTYVLLNEIGTIGAAWALFISYAIGTIITIIAAIRSYHMPWMLKYAD